MQKNKFAQAANCMDTQEQSTSKILTTPTKVTTRSESSPLGAKTMTPGSLSKVAKTKHRYGSANYWKFMFEQSQTLIKESYEKSQDLKENPRLLTVQKVKPKDLSMKKAQE